MMYFSRHHKCFTLLLVGLLFVRSHIAVLESAYYFLFSFWLFLVLPVVRLWVLHNWSCVVILAGAGRVESPCCSLSKMIEQILEAVFNRSLAGN